MSYSFRQAAIGEEEGGCKMAAKRHYKRQSQFEDGPLKSTQNPCKKF